MGKVIDIPVNIIKKVIKLKNRAIVRVGDLRSCPFMFKVHQAKDSEVTFWSSSQVSPCLTTQ